MFIASAPQSADRKAQTAKDRLEMQSPQPSRRQTTDSKWDGEGIPGNAWGVDKNGGLRDGDEGWPGIKDSKPPTGSSSDVPEALPSNDGSNQGGSGDVGGGTNDNPPSAEPSSSPNRGEVSPGVGVPGQTGSGGQDLPPASPLQSTTPSPTGSPLPSPSALQSPGVPNPPTLGDAAERPPVNAVGPVTTATAPVLGFNETRHSIPTSSAASPSTTTLNRNDHEGHPSNKTVVIAVTVSLLIFLLAISFALFRYLRARRTNSRTRWWFHWRHRPSFHDDSLPSSRADTPNGMEDTFSSTLSSMSFASRSGSPMVQAHPSPTSGEPRRHLQILSAVSGHRSDWSTLSSHDNLDGSSASDDHSKLHIHPLSHSKPSMSSLSPLGLKPAEDILPMPPTSHNTALSHSSFASTALSYTDPFSDHASPSTAFATSPEPLSSVPPSSDWHLTESEASFPNTFSSMSSNDSSIPRREPRIIIVSSARYDDTDSVDYHYTFR